MNRTGKPVISSRFLRIWNRNFMIYRKTWKVSFMPPLLEPIMYLAAFGLGMSALVGDVSWHDGSMSYIVFIAPALVSVNMMYNSFFETTYGSFVRMYYQKTFDAMMATPLFLEEIITGEIIWGATKSVIASTIMLGIISLFGLIRYPEGLLLIPLAFLAGLAFASIGMYFTAVVRNIDLFNLPIFLFITPMFLFGGTFFPLDTLPEWSKVLAYCLPLTHLVEISRAIGIGPFDGFALWNLLYLTLFSIIFFPLALVKMRKRLIK
jgi:lipooligosaccharide transport system permease protein